MRRFSWSMLVLLSAAICGTTARAAETEETTDAAGLDLFVKRIRPVLVKHCYKCHSLQSKELKGGLRLDTRDAARRGGESGAAVVPGKVGDSLIVSALEHEDFEMPPSKKLPGAVIADFRRWIELGAPDPREGGASEAISESIDIEAGRKFWSFQPPKNHAPPKVKNTAWPKSDIDRFILTKLEGAELAPADDADRETLIRRATFSLVGLPPTPEEIDAFVTDTSPDAFAKVVDRLLASPHFGERWARHWLDVARYAESSGGGRTLILPNAWRYRDYVIRSFNADKPFDQFIREQVAGDLLAHKSDEEKSEHTIATGFLALGPTNYELQDKHLLRLEVIDEQLDTIGRSMLGMTIGCARCHDHKFDPIPTRDYYALAGIFGSTKSFNPGNVAQPIHVKIALKKKDPKAVIQVLSVLEAKPHDAHLRIRGGVRNFGPVVPRGVLRVATQGNRPPMPSNQSGRLELANWIASDENPLTARVMANRVWQHLLGEGLVRTPDNFGAMGERPTHAELLDHLALRLVENGWSVKKLIREIMLTRTYQLSSNASAAATKRDPENRLLSHAHRRRLDAEVIRDTVLVVSGKLDRTAFGPTMRKGTDSELTYQFNSVRRSVYVPSFRNTQLDMLSVFDAANPNVVTGRRGVSTLPTQSLLMMNSPDVIEQSQHAAKRLIADTPDAADAARLNLLYRRALGRPPRDAEIEQLTAFLTTQKNDGVSAEKAWAKICQSVFACIDFRYVY